MTETGLDLADPAAYLAAALDEAEATARAAAEECAPPWKSYPGKGIVEHSGPVPNYEGVFEREDQLWDSEGCTESWRRLCMDETVAKHVAVNDPAHALRVVAAHRKLLASHRPGGWQDSECQECVHGADHYGDLLRESWPCDTVKILAEAYGWTA